MNLRYQVFFLSRNMFSQRNLLSQTNLVRNLELSKRQSEILGSRLQQWNFLKQDANIAFNRHELTNEFQSYFTVDDDDHNLVFSNYVNALFESFGQIHNPNEWRLFIHGSTKSKFTFSST